MRQALTEERKIADRRDGTDGMTRARAFADLTDGRNGVRVVQLFSPGTDPRSRGFSPRPTPELIATYDTHGPAVAVSKGLDRDRAVDESGHQTAVFGRIGARPFTLEEQQRFYLSNGEVYRVSDELPSQARQP